MSPTALVRSLLAALAAAAASAVLVPAALAQGIVLPRDVDRIRRPDRPPVERAVPLEVRSLAVEVEIRGRVATTRMDQVFWNPSDRELEGTYLFPLPDGAAVEKFSMFVDGVEMAGEVLDASRARGIYEDIVRSRRDPALLEFVGQGLFRASIFPIPPRSEKRVKLSYSEMLRGDAGTVTWRFPLANARHSPTAIGRASIAVDVATDRRLAAAFSPTHRLDFVRRGERTGRGSWEAADVRPDQDFVLILQEPAGDLGISFAAHRPPGEDGSFLLLLAPAVDADAMPIPRDVVLCVDTSGSMAGPKMEQARGALRYAIRTLGPEDRFALVAFATEPRRFREALVPADAAGKEAALAFVESLQAVGGTCIDDALQSTLALVKDGPGERPAVALFVTDGLPTIGERDPAAILERARKAAGPRVRLFTFGVGHDVDARLLDRLAEELRGARDYVVPGEDIEVKVSALVAKTTHPVMTDLSLTVEGASVRDLYPRRLPDLFRGSELAVLGRYASGGKAVIRVCGRLRGGEKEFVQEVEFPAREEGAAFLGRLWAIRRVGHLLDEIRLRGETAEVREEVVRLAKRHGILTPYTSWLVLEDDAAWARSGGRERAGRRGWSEVEEALRRKAREAGLGFNGPAGEPAPDGGGDIGGDGGGGDSGGGSGGGDSGTPAPARGPAPTPPAPGAAAVGGSLEAKKLNDADRAEEDGKDRLRDVVRVLDGRTFYLRDGVWWQAEVAADAPRTKVVAFSKEYLDLAASDRALAKAFALGRVVVRMGEVVYEVVD